MMKKSCSLHFVAVMSGLAFSFLARAEVPTNLEPPFSEAVISYNNKAYDKALIAVEELLKTNGNVLEFWELKALTLKASNNEAGSVEAYTQMIELGKSGGKTPKEVAPYHFEVGVIQFRQNKYKEAVPHLVEAARWNFNVAPSRFFLGTIAYKSSQWASAEQNFTAVTASDVDALRPAAAFYLGQIALKTDYSSGAIQNFYEARKQSQDQIKDPKISEETKKAAQQIYDATTQVLKPYENSQVFGNVSLITGYDSNVLSVPSTETSAAATGNASIKETVQVAFGYASAPLGKIQFVPSYKSAFNYNFNSDTRSGEFMTHDASIYITKDALSRTNYGMKIQGIYTLQAQTSSDTGKSSLTQYGLTGSFGPYLRHDLSRRLQLNAELFLQPQKNYLDQDLTETLKRSGTQGVLHVGLKNDMGSKFWNPAMTLNLDSSSTTGAEYRYKAIGATLADTLRLTDPLASQLTVDLNHLTYSDRPDGVRTDTVVTVGLSETYKWKKQMSILGDIQYIRSASTVADAYQFNRFMLSLGISYSLL